MPNAWSLRTLIIGTYKAEGYTATCAGHRQILLVFLMLADLQEPLRSRRDQVITGRCKPWHTG